MIHGRQYGVSISGVLRSPPVKTNGGPQNLVVQMVYLMGQNWIGGASKCCWIGWFKPINKISAKKPKDWRMIHERRIEILTKKKKGGDSNCTSNFFLHTALTVIKWMWRVNFELYLKSIKKKKKKKKGNKWLELMLRDLQETRKKTCLGQPHCCGVPVIKIWLDLFVCFAMTSHFLVLMLLSLVLSWLETGVVASGMTIAVLALYFWPDGSLCPFFFVLLLGRGVLVHYIFTFVTSKRFLLGSSWLVLSTSLCDSAQPHDIMELQIDFFPWAPPIHLEWGSNLVVHRTTLPQGWWNLHKPQWEHDLLCQ